MANCKIEDVEGIGEVIGKSSGKPESKIPTGCFAHVRQAQRKELAEKQAFQKTDPQVCQHG